MSLASRLRTRAEQVRALVGDAPSPCSSVCRMDGRTGWCEGCMRTLDEIVAWGRLPDADRRVIWTRIEQRATAIRTPLP